MTASPKNAKTAAIEALIEAHAIELKLPTVRRRFRALADEAIREQQTPVAYLAALLEAEIAERAERREKRRVIDARFPQIKRLEDFRFADNPNVPPATIAALAEGSWIEDRESVIFIGDSGTGKTMLATALAVCACHQGRRVRFTTLAGLANELQEAQSRRELARVVGRYARTELVLLDELGYLALPDGAAELVFYVLSERHERGSLICTTNLPFGEWTKVFPDPRLAKAVFDRLTHRAHIIDTGAEVLALPPRPPEERRRLTPDRARCRAPPSAYGLRLRDSTSRPITTATSGKINQAQQPTRSGATSNHRAGANASRRSQRIWWAGGWRCCGCARPGRCRRRSAIAPVTGRRSTGPRCRCARRSLGASAGSSRWSARCRLEGRRRASAST
jgi:DNA replication protein DnaC